MYGIDPRADVIPLKPVKLITRSRVSPGGSSQRINRRTAADAIANSFVDVACTLAGDKVVGRQRPEVDVRNQSRVLRDIVAKGAIRMCYG
jgi:hypothetical protein